MILQLTYVVMLRIQDTRRQLNFVKVYNLSITLANTELLNIVENKKKFAYI